VAAPDLIHRLHRGEDHHHERNEEEQGGDDQEGIDADPGRRKPLGPGPRRLGAEAVSGCDAHDVLPLRAARQRKKLCSATSAAMGSSMQVAAAIPWATLRELMLSMT